MHRYILGALALALTATPAAAQGWIEVERRPTQPPIQGSISRVGSDVRVTVDGRIARVEVEERFRNDGGRVAEGSYLYPLPGEAVFQNFSLWMGEQEMKGEMLTAEQARGIYEEIVRRQRDPALLTLAGHGLVRAQVFPIQPGETRKVVLRYTQLLERSGDAVRVRYALGQRGGTAGSWRLTTAAEAGFGTPYSPTHAVTADRAGGRLQVSLDPARGGDVELFLPLRRGLVGTTALAHAPGGEAGYVMLLLAPAAEVTGAAVPRDVSFVVDVSGSMSGSKLAQAQAALRQALETLGPADRFQLIAFSSGVRRFREGFTPATAANRQAAREFVDALSADGGTNISGALEAALAATVAEDRLPLVIFLTDGIPSVGEQQPERIAAMAAARGGRSRVFTFGIGHDVNTYLLDRLAKEGRGTSDYVAPDATVEDAVGRLMGKLRHPALVNLRLVSSPVRFRDLTPGRLPDLFFGEELVLFGRYEGSGSGAVIFEGERNGRRERFVAEASFPTQENDNDFIPRLWASRRVGDLTRQIRLEGASESLIREVRELGLRYGILTEYTSYLVQEPQLAANRLEDAATGPGRRRLDAQPMSAPPPSAQVGRAAVEQAQASGQMAKATNLAEADALAERRLAGESAEVRRAGGRLFRRQGDVWTDVAHADSLRVVTVAPFSAAYFAVTRALPELREALAIADQALVAGRRASLAVGPTGRTTLAEAELRAFVRDFRGGT
ncbi:MAG: VWA domain-containing protein [Gemmatimonadetes bacterium]|nr:VWA domain-containing protein [Gemmatimonadota bacterium]